MLNKPKTLHPKRVDALFAPSLPQQQHQVSTQFISQCQLYQILSTWKLQLRVNFLYQSGRTVAGVPLKHQTPPHLSHILAIVET